MSMNMMGEHCPNCGDDLEEGQIGLCDFCTSESDGDDTHGSPELDADARKLEAMGQDAGPTFADLADAPFTALVISTIGTLASCIEQNQRAWEGEEDSVQAEHRDLMNKNRGVLVAYELLLAKIKEAANGK